MTEDERQGPDGEYADHAVQQLRIRAESRTEAASGIAASKQKTAVPTQKTAVPTQKTAVPTQKTAVPNKKIVIPSREARTVRTKHEDIPELAEAIRRERDRQEAEALIAAGYPPTPVSTSLKSLRRRSSGRVPKFGEATEDDPGWAGGDEVFDPETFSAEHDSVAPPAIPARDERTSRVGVLLLVLVLVAAAGGAAVFYLR